MQKTIHVATISEVNSESGQGVRLRQLLTHMASFYQIHLLAPPTDSLNLPGNRLIHRTLYGDICRAFTQRPFSLAVLRPLSLLYSQLRTFLRDARVIYTDQPMVLLCAQFVASRIHRVVEVNGIACEEWIAKGRIKNRRDIRFRIMRFMEALAYRKAHRLIAVSSGIRDYVTQEFGVYSSRVHVIPNGIHPHIMKTETHARTVRNRIGLSDEPVALFVGSFRPWHGIWNLIRALPFALKRVPDLKLVLVGDGPTRADCETLVHETGLEPSVLFTGHQSPASVSELLSITDVCVYYPDYHVARYGFIGDPIKLREYMAVGKPVVTIRLPNFAEVIEEEECGLVVEPRHPQFGQAIAELILDPLLARTLGQNGQRVVADRYNWSVIASRIFDLIEDLTREEQNPS